MVMEATEIKQWRNSTLVSETSKTPSEYTDNSCRQNINPSSSQTNHSSPSVCLFFFPFCCKDLSNYAVSSDDLDDGSAAQRALAGTAEQLAGAL